MWRNPSPGLYLPQPARRIRNPQLRLHHDQPVRCPHRLAKRIRNLLLSLCHQQEARCLHWLARIIKNPRLYLRHHQLAHRLHQPPQRTYNPLLSLTHHHRLARYPSLPHHQQLKNHIPGQHAHLLLWKRITCCRWGHGLPQYHLMAYPLPRSRVHAPPPQHLSLCPLNRGGPVSASPLTHLQYQDRHLHVS